MPLIFPRWAPIPNEFQSLFHEGLFPRCCDCERDLLTGECQYWIERIFRGTEPICEMAICWDCRAKITEELSKDSMMRINAYVEERFDFEKRLEESMQWPIDSLDPWLDRCILTKTSRAECKSYQIAALCNGDRMACQGLPMMISEQAVADMQKLMSKKTRDRLGQWMDDLFGMPSEFVDGPEQYSPMIF